MEVLGIVNIAISTRNNYFRTCAREASPMDFAQVFIGFLSGSSNSELMSGWTRHNGMAIFSVREELGLVQEIPEDILSVNYEELCIWPRGLLEEITSFPGPAEDDERFLRY